MSLARILARVSLARVPLARIVMLTAALLAATELRSSPGFAQDPFPMPTAAPVPSSPASSGYANCQPPKPSEYLLLIPSRTPDLQERVRRSLPASPAPIVCSYLGDVVTRVGGFTTIDAANAWARYLKETVGAAAFVAQPATAPAPTQSSMTPPQTTPQITSAQASQTQTRAYNPQPLGTGYAVLVDFFSKPELVAQVQQATGGAVGLVAYGQRPYLLAMYTADQTVANSTLQSLIDRGLWAMVVDSRRVLLLRQAIDVQRATR